MLQGKLGFYGLGFYGLRVIGFRAWGLGLRAFGLGFRVGCGKKAEAACFGGIPEVYNRPERIRV